MAIEDHIMQINQNFKKVKTSKNDDKQVCILFVMRAERDLRRLMLTKQ